MDAILLSLVQIAGLSLRLGNINSAALSLLDGPGWTIVRFGFKVSTTIQLAYQLKDKVELN